MTARGARAEAKAAGSTTYWNGKPCPKGHVSDRVTVHGGCAECGRTRARTNSRRRYKADPAKATASAIAYRARNTDRVNARLRKWSRAKRVADPVWKLGKNLRTRIYCALRRGRAASAIRDLGCTVEELKAYLEGQFVPGMTWDNYGPVWHVDHRRALSEFDLTDKDQARQACHYTNLQPLFALDNLRKSGVRKRPSQELSR